MPAKEAEEWLNAEVLEVDIYCKTNAGVFAKVRYRGKDQIDVHWFTRENGRWLNSGNSVVETLEEARELFSGRSAREEARIKLDARPPIANPEEYLRPFVEFLRREATDPMTLMLQALATHRVVIIGEVHHRPRYWAFNSALVCDKAFPERVGVIFMELPCNDEPLVEQFLAAPTYDPQPIIEILRDMQMGGWPDQAELDFIKTVWEVNQGLPNERRLRIVLVDNPWPWKEIITPADWKRFDIGRMEQNRNQIMTDNILRDLREHAADPRHALFIVGYVHATENPSFPDLGVGPWKPVGWRLCEKLGRTNVFAVFPHSPVLADQGGIDRPYRIGHVRDRICGADQPAYGLSTGPWPVRQASLRCFNGRVDHSTISPLFPSIPLPRPGQNETFAPLIPNFYTDDFVKEVDRRLQLWQGKGLREMGLKRLDAASFIEFDEEEGQWGVLRPEWLAGSLGPISAWEFGSDWKQKMVAAKLKNWEQDKVAIRKDACAYLTPFGKPITNIPAIIFPSRLMWSTRSK